MLPCMFALTLVVTRTCVRFQIHLRCRPWRIKWWRTIHCVRLHFSRDFPPSMKRNSFLEDEDETLAFWWVLDFSDCLHGRTLSRGLGHCWAPLHCCVVVIDDLDVSLFDFATATYLIFGSCVRGRWVLCQIVSSVLFTLGEDVFL